MTVILLIRLQSFY